jgi:hypothetical protein
MTPEARQARTTLRVREIERLMDECPVESCGARYADVRRLAVSRAADQWALEAPWGDRELPDRSESIKVLSA